MSTQSGTSAERAGALQGYLACASASRSMVSFFASTSSIRSGVGAIENPDQSGKVFEQSGIPEVLEKRNND